MFRRQPWLWRYRPPSPICNAITNPFRALPLEQLINYIEVMYRRGYTKGCGTTSDARRKYCPSDLLTRGQMAVFLIRAKMSNVFPTTLSGIPLAVNAGPAGGSVGTGSAYGDNFGLFTPAQSYFYAISATVPDYYIYIQKMRELRITNGTGATTYAARMRIDACSRLPPSL